MTSCLHRLASEGLTAPGEVGSNHHALVLLEVVAHFAYVPLVVNRKLFGLKVFKFDVFELGLLQCFEVEMMSDVLLTRQLPMPWSKLKTSQAFASLSVGMVKKSVLTE